MQVEPSNLILHPFYENSNLEIFICFIKIVIYVFSYFLFTILFILINTITNNIFINYA